MYISQSENSKSKICNLAHSNPIRVENLLFFALSPTVSEIMANLLFQGHVTLKVKLPKIEKFKICYFACSNHARVKNYLCFALSLIVPEITANLNFLKICPFLTSQSDMNSRWRSPENRDHLHTDKFHEILFISFWVIAFISHLWPRFWRLYTRKRVELQHVRIQTFVCKDFININDGDIEFEERLKYKLLLPMQRLHTEITITRCAKSFETFLCLTCW